MDVRHGNRCGFRKEGEVAMGSGTGQAWLVTTPSLKSVWKSLRYGPTGPPQELVSRMSILTKKSFLRCVSRCVLRCVSGRKSSLRCVSGGCLISYFAEINFE